MESESRTFDFYDCYTHAAGVHTDFNECVILSHHHVHASQDCVQRVEGLSPHLTARDTRASLHGLGRRAGGDWREDADHDAPRIHRSVIDLERLGVTSGKGRSRTGPDLRETRPERARVSVLRAPWG